MLADTGEEALDKAALHPSAARIGAVPVMRLRQGIWWEYCAVFEEGAA